MFINASSSYPFEGFLHGVVDTWRSITNTQPDPAPHFAVPKSDSLFPNGLTVPAHHVPSFSDSIGINLYFDPHAPSSMPTREALNQMKQAGITTARVDFRWNDIEMQKNHYDWAPFDQLTTLLAEYGIKPSFILENSNPDVYPDTRSGLGTEQGRQEFSTFAQAAAQHFKGRVQAWELLNEPNWTINWNPEHSSENNDSANALDYVLLARSVMPAIHSADPGAARLSAGAGGDDFSGNLKWFEDTFKDGLLNEVDYVTVHPYRAYESGRYQPESAIEDINQLKSLVHLYASGNTPSVITGEWGYSDYGLLHTGLADSQDDAEILQGALTVREFLVDASLGEERTVVHQWKENGFADGEGHFGLLDSTGKLKPSYQAVRAMNRALQRMRFVEQISDPSNPDNYFFKFTSIDGKRSKIAAWTTGGENTADIPLAGQTKLLTEMPQYYDVVSQEDSTGSSRGVKSLLG